MFVSFIWAKGGQTLKVRRYKIADELGQTKQALWIAFMHARGIFESPVEVSFNLGLYILRKPHFVFVDVWGIKLWAILMKNMVMKLFLLFIIYLFINIYFIINNL